MRPPDVTTAVTGFHLTDKHIRWLVITMVCAVAGYLGIVLWTGREQVGLALARVGWSGTLITLLLSLANYGLRFIRWQGYLRIQGHKIAWRFSLLVYLAGFALTTTPGKAGEAIRGLLLKLHDVPYSHSFAAFFSERLSDLLAVVVLALVGITLYPQLQPLFAVGAAAVLLGLLVLNQKQLPERLLQITQQRPHKIYRAAESLLYMLIQAQRCHGGPQLLSATLLSLIAWFAEALAFYWVLNWMGADVSLQFAIFVYAISMLAGALSLMPGGLGGAEAVMVGLLVWSGMQMPEAIAATVLIRTATLWFAVGLGLIALIQYNALNTPPSDV